MILSVKHLSTAGLLTLLMSGCSITDRGNDYQLSRSNDRPLVVEDGAFYSTDKLVIPNEQSIPVYKERHDFIAPDVPKPYVPFADLKIVWQDNQMWIESSSNLSSMKTAVTEFFSTLSGEQDVFHVKADNRLETFPISFVQQSWLGALWSNITRLYPEKAVYEVVFESKGKVNRLGLRYQTIKTDINGEDTVSDWLTPKADERVYSTALDLWGQLSTKIKNNEELLSARNQTEPNSLWLDYQGNYAVRLNTGSDKQTLINIINKSPLHLINNNPLEVAFIPASEIPKVGELKKLVLPPLGGERIVLGNIRRRNLDDLTWEQRSYPVILDQRSNGVFVSIDASEADQPKLVSYRVMQELFQTMNSN
ncbi:hypothetical protein CBF23_008120 [Marinomonas agarivorans]|nr:hypothetical protein CBF23_008120 [Marinomonas agarivorans]